MVTVVEFKLLGSEEFPDSHTSTLGLFYQMGLVGNLWAIGIRAVKVEGREWEVAARDCPRGDRYNDLPCGGRGKCVSGTCVCTGRYSGDRCQEQGSLHESDLHWLGNLIQVLGVLIVGASMCAHLMSWIVVGGLFKEQMWVAGDHFSLLLHLQFMALTVFLDTSVPVQVGCTWGVRGGVHGVYMGCTGGCTCHVRGVGCTGSVRAPYV
jgi:hypothetical protein